MNSTNCQESFELSDNLLARDYRLFQKTPVWELAKAMQNNDLRKIELITNKGNIDINFREAKFGQTLLFLAIWNHQVETCEILLESGADPNIHQTYDNQTPLILSASISETQIAVPIIELLVKHGADVNASQVDSSQIVESPYSLPIITTPLIAACARGNSYQSDVPKVKILVDAGAEINFIGNHNTSPLRKALYTDNLDVALFLLENGADFNQLLWEKSKYDQSKPTYILDFLRELIFDFNSKEYEYKMRIVSFLETKGLNYWQHPVHPRVVREIKKQYPSKWEVYLEKY